MRKILLVLAVLIVVLIVADRISLYLAQRKIANRVASAYDVSGQPAVTIHGFPFLTQVIAGNYQQVDVVIASVVQGGVRLQNLRARFDGVHAPLGELVNGNSTKEITADHAAATALIPFATVQQRLPAGIRLSPDGGKLKLSGSLGYQGLVVPISAAVTLHVTSNAIEVTPRNITVGGTVPIPPVLLGSRLAIMLPIHNLPMRLEVTSVRVTSTGFQVSASAHDVAFTNNG